MKRIAPMAIRAESPLVSGYTLCHITHEGNRIARFAKDGGRINCPNCRIMVNYCRSFDAQYRTPMYATVTG